MPYRGVCEICHHPGIVVRDHDHNSGHIRGWLCVRCNRFLGVYENQPRFGDVYPEYAPRHKYRRWYKRFGGAIEHHRQKDTGIVYEGNNEPPRTPMPPKHRRRCGKKLREPRGPVVHEIPESKAREGLKQETARALAAYRAFLGRPR